MQAGKKSVICCTFTCNIELRFLSIVLHKQEDMHLSVDVTREKEGLPSDNASYKWFSLIFNIWYQQRCCVIMCKWTLHIDNTDNTNFFYVLSFLYRLVICHCTGKHCCSVQAMEKSKDISPRRALQPCGKGKLTIWDRNPE